MRALNARGNRLQRLESGALQGANQLRVLFLSDNGMQSADPDAFSNASSLSWIWIPGNALNCSRLVAALPSSQQDAFNCFDAVHCRPDGAEVEDSFHVASIGDGECNINFDTVECAKDGRDC